MTSLDTPRRPSTPPDPSAAPGSSEDLFGALYRELHDLARHHLHRQGEGYSLGTTTLLHCHHGFGQRLEHAITVQTRNTGHLGNRVQQARGVLVLREQRVAAVRKLIEHRQAELQTQADRRDQRNTDDAAQRARSVSAAQAVPAQPLR